MGTLLTAVALSTPAATTAALFYLIHAVFAAAALVLISDQIAARRGAVGDRLVVAPRISEAGLLAGLFFLAAIGMTGMPPLTGFLGKLLVLDSARESASMVVVWTVILVTSLLTIVGFARAGSTVFWKSTSRSEEHTSELQSLMRSSYAVFCLKKKKHNTKRRKTLHQ